MKLLIVFCVIFLAVIGLLFFSSIKLYKSRNNKNSSSSDKEGRTFVEHELGEKPQ